jgi:hypothetical protein
MMLVTSNAISNEGWEVIVMRFGLKEFVAKKTRLKQSPFVEATQRAPLGERYSELPRNLPPRNRERVSPVINFAMTP